MNPIFQYWYFHLPNFILAAVMYTMIGRLLLSFFAPQDWKNYIWRAFVRITDPVLRPVRFITPAVLPDPVVLIFAALWLMLIRVGFFALLASLSLLPTISSSG
ncbi:MAG: YggT family protein [Rhizobiales bacterium]|nr:YggT family protein [Hyphomicrobiales bacterium]